MLDAPGPSNSDQQIQDYQSKPNFHEEAMKQIGELDIGDSFEKEYYANPVPMILRVDKSFFQPIESSFYYRPVKLPTKPSDEFLIK